MWSRSVWPKENLCQPSLNHDGGPALPLHPVYLPCLVHLLFQWLAQAASEVEGEVLVGLLTLLPNLHEPWLRPHGQTSRWSWTLPSPSFLSSPPLSDMENVCGLSRSYS